MIVKTINDTKVEYQVISNDTIKGTVSLQMRFKDPNKISVTSDPD